ncbi:toxin-antitoxin system HicB family antitoxin [Candidatus Protochlamydia sp. W-9]|uniref:toxin-antitoxin system HicB family antitoxin n=1 Tax=Candidatus Protochlamydia sp. W-9 TaxID=1785087 RepID=UPI0009AED2F6|nr:toxin-antitoxin system HicB family antitoxin [Candidatus Protochlamydia sp. W-9]
MIFKGQGQFKGLGQEPENPFSRNICLRLKSDFHTKLAVEEKLNGISFSNYIS